MVIAGTVSEALLLELVLGDGDTGKFPQVSVYDSAGAPVSGSPFNLTHVALGLYQATWTNPSTEGHFSAIFVVYNEAGHTIVSNKYDRVAEHVRIEPSRGGLS